MAPAALVTGGGAGIGRAVCLHLAKAGYDLTVVDLSEDWADATAGAARSTGVLAIGVKCDVTNPEELRRAFAAHMREHGRLDVCCNNAGIEEKGDNLMQGGLSNNWRAVLAVNTSAVVDGTFQAVEIMRSGHQQGHKGGGGVIINIASTGGLYPMPYAPVYAASKSAVVMFCRSLAGLKKEGIRVAAVCPQFTDTSLVQRQLDQDPSYSKVVSGTQQALLSVDTVAEGVMKLVRGAESGGAVMRVTVARGHEYCVPVNKGFAAPPTREEKIRLLREDQGGAEAPRAKL